MGPGVGPENDNSPETAGHEECEAHNQKRLTEQTKESVEFRNMEGKEESHYLVQMCERDDQIKVAVREGKHI